MIFDVLVLAMLGLLVAGIWSHTAVLADVRAELRKLTAKGEGE